MQQSEPSMFWKNTNVCNEYTCMHRALFWVLVEKYFSSTTRALLHSIFQLFVPDRGDICQRHWPRTDSGQTCFTKSLKCNLMGLKGKVHISRKQWWKVTCCWKRFDKSHVRSIQDNSSFQQLGFQLQQNHTLCSEDTFHIHCLFNHKLVKSNKNKQFLLKSTLRALLSIGSDCQSVQIFFLSKSPPLLSEFSSNHQVFFESPV